jgi:hypothetical protein
MLLMLENDRDRIERFTRVLDSVAIEFVYTEVSPLQGFCVRLGSSSQGCAVNRLPWAITCNRVAVKTSFGRSLLSAPNMLNVALVCRSNQTVAMAVPFRRDCGSKGYVLRGLVDEEAHRCIES